MPQKQRRLKIAHKLPLAVIGAALVACLCVGAGSYFVADRAVATLTEDKLEALAQERARELTDHFAGIKEDLLVSAASSNTITALKGMKMGWDQLVEDQGAKLVDFYITNNPYGENERQLFDQSESLASYNRTHGRYHPGFRSQAATRGYNDVYLFDVNGNLLYSVMKRADFGANVATDAAWTGTPLASAFNAAISLGEPGGIIFIDTLPYLGKHASFVATPVFEGNDLSGVLAFKISNARIDAILNTRLGLGETGETFLLGSDYLFRNDSPFSAEADEGATRYETGIVAEALATGRVTSGWESGYRGMDMLASAAPLSFEGVTWVLVAALSETEAMAAVDNMGLWIVAITGAVVLIAAVLGYLISRSLTRPVSRLTQSMKELAQGDLDVDVKDAERTDELGEMARAVEVFRANAVRVHELTEDERLSSEQRMTDRAAMMHTLQAGFGDVVDAAVAGDFSRRVRANFADPELNALAHSVNNLVETVEVGLGQALNVLGALANADLTERVEGDVQGAFAQLRDDLNRVGETLTSTMIGLRHTSRSLKVATSEILSGANDLSERTTQQAATIEETSAAIEQLSATVIDNARRAAEASQKSQALSNTATEGGDVMRLANEAMERIIASSGKISNIIGLIDDIAFQTNLLALNASVEAARAGEAGRGFAVVAVEVRRLAQSAAKASSDVKALIQQSGTEVQGGSKRVAEAADKLLVMLTAAKESSALIDDIAKASREQASAIAEVSQAMRILDSMTQHNAALVEETNASIEQTEGQAIELDRIVDGFVLERDDSRIRAA